VSVDADHPAACVEERAAGVSGRDRRVGLDEIDEGGRQAA